jgi:hypothetical protein
MAILSYFWQFFGAEHFKLLLTSSLNFLPRMFNKNVAKTFQNMDLMDPKRTEAGWPLRLDAYKQATSGFHSNFLP